MALNSTTTVNRTYDPQGASVPNGVRGGNFFLPNGALNPGIEIAQTIPTVERINQGGTIFSIAVAGSATVYVPLSSLISGLGASIVYSEDGSYIQLGNSTQLSITTSASTITWLASGYDRYQNKMVNGSQPGTPVSTTGLSTRCFNRLTSIKLTNNTATPCTVTIATTNSIELPYYDFGQQALLLSCRNESRPLWIAPSVAASSLPINWDFTYTPGTIPPGGANSTLNPITAVINLYSGTPRPFISLTTFVADTGTPTIETLCIRQAVFGYGSLPSWFVDYVGAPSLINGGGIFKSDPPSTIADYYTSSYPNLSLIGHPQYATGWTGWQG